MQFNWLTIDTMIVTKTGTTISTVIEAVQTFQYNLRQFNSKVQKVTENKKILCESKTKKFQNVTQKH